MTEMYSAVGGTRTTPQNMPIPGAGQTQNRSGGHGWTVDRWTQLERFLILGVTTSTYYASQRELTGENVQSILDCIAEDGMRTIDTAVSISTSGRAPSNDPALFVLAVAAGYKADPEVRKSALTLLPLVARIGTHWHHFCKYVTSQRGWGRALRAAIAKHVFIDPSLETLTHQVLKYGQRDGWSYRDMLRLSHPKTEYNEQNLLFSWIADPSLPGPTERIRAVKAVAELHADGGEGTLKKIVRLIHVHNLTREMLPTGVLDRPEVWEALLVNMPMGAMIRSLNKLTAVGVVNPGSTGMRDVVRRLHDSNEIRRSRVHPLAVLTAMKTYSNGHGMRGSLTWTPVGMVVDALQDAFYESFGNIVPANKHVLTAVDVSGSMRWGEIANSVLSPREAAAAMMMVTMRTEPMYTTVAFSRTIVPLPISATSRLDDVVRATAALPFGRTDCAAPMLHALKKGINNVDAFVIYTDNETWCGDVHPSQALQLYRDKTGADAKLAVVAMTADKFTIADPKDSGMMDVVGFDAAAPAVIADFIR